MAEHTKPYSPSYRDEIALVRHFVGVLEQKLAGRESARRADSHPLDWCHLGVVGPSKPQHNPVVDESETIEGDPGSEEVAGDSASPSAKQTRAPVAEVANEARGDAGEHAPGEVLDYREAVRRPPSAIGFEVLVEPDAAGKVELELASRFVVFTKHLPTRQEQLGALGGEPSIGAPLRQVVQRWQVEAPSASFDIDSLESRAYRDDGRVQAAVNSLLETAFAKDDAEREWSGTRPKIDDANVLASDAAYDQHLSGLSANLAKEKWAIDACIEVRASPRPDGKVRLGCYVVNLTPETPALVKGRGLKDAFKILGDVQITARIVRGAMQPIEILPVPQDYQYDRRVWAVGHNTSVVADPTSGAIRTAALALFEQPRISTRDRPPAKFKDLAEEPFPVLDAVFASMQAYADEWERDVLGSNSLNFSPDALLECERDYRGFLEEVDRFAAGVAALKASEKLLQAFKATNKVFGRLARGYDSWRLFQLVFFVTQLTSLLVRERVFNGEYPPGVTRNWKTALTSGDVLWFRTGGGKTEAYLALACCAMLFDRIRGKAFGVTAWLRFPLRMLSIQQLQRAMRVIWEAEVERKSLLGAEAGKTDPLRLGYFVGGSTTPNALSKEILEKFVAEERLEGLRIVPDCPACEAKGSVQITADTTRVRFRHVCSECKAELPLDVSDDEVYRYLPALIVGTIDKMATVGQQPKFGMLWGGAKWKCPTHGYAFGQNCVVWGCKIEKRQRIPIAAYDSSPSLHIQDELHLLQEELGAFAGHYETLIRYCEAAVGGLPSKVIAATATIEGFEHQMKDLYGVRSARRFPGRSYDRMRSFYAEPEVTEDGSIKTARVFVAFKTTSMPPADASAYCTEIIQGEITNLARNPHLALAFLLDAKTNEDVGLLLRYYTTSLNYVSSLQRGSRVRQSLEDSSAKIRGEGDRDLNVEYHSSRSSSAQVADLVHRVETPPAWSDGGFLDALVATNMISHGVDLERVNLMAMDGVPEEMAEYIQASSRSGRRHVGLVMVVLAGFSLRATSIYHRFLEFHRHLERMVSPVPINRFAKFAAQRTAPGIALGLVYGLHIAKSGKAELNRRIEVVALLEGLGGDFGAQINDAYALGKGIYDDRLERDLLETLSRATETIELSVRTSHEKLVKDAIRPAPMTSLRDVEAGVPFWPDADDSRLLAFVQKTRE